MNVIIVGCGRVGSELAYRLFLNGHQVTIVDRHSEAFKNLPSDFRGRTLEGDVLSEAVLHRAGIETAQAVAAVTSSDSLNGVIGRIASDIYHIQRVTVRNYNPRWRGLLEAFGLQVVGSSSWGAQRMEELLEGGAVHPVVSAGNGEVEICDLTIPPSWEGRSVQELAAVGPCIVAAITRAGRGILPTPDMIFKTGDVVHVSTSTAGMTPLRQKIV
ncbi:MAG: TrkA family potassium uptake protein [Caldilineales bacterium]